MKFSRPVYGSGKRELTQIAFGGYNHTRSASEGELYDMRNLTCADYPILSTRPKRGVYEDEGIPVGDFLGCVVYDNYICIVKRLYNKSEAILSIGKIGADSKHNLTFKISEGDTRKRTFTFLNDYMIMFPDKKYIKLSDLNSENDIPIYDMEASFSSVASIGEGTYGGVSAEANTITLHEDAELPDFSVGDAVTISGCSVPENNKTAIIEEIHGNKLIFLENCFKIPEGETEYTEENITVARLVPDLDFLCGHANRLYGCKGDTIYVSKLGNPLVWYNYEGAAGAWSADVGSPGDFTACYSYGSYILFFKEEMVYKLYGSRPDNFQLSPVATIGVKKGSFKGLAVASDVLFYHSRVGIMAYTGGAPRIISSNFGEVQYKNAIGGSDGVDYYVSLEDDKGKRTLFKYDTLRGIWMKEDDMSVWGIFFDKTLYFVKTNGFILTVDQSLESGNSILAENLFGIISFAEFGDFYTSLDKKVMSCLYARFELEEGTTVKIFIKFDSGEWEELTSVTAEGKRMVTIPIVPRRCDHYRIKIEGEGGWRLYALSREGYTASKK